jgi:hypothetical protein
MAYATDDAERPSASDYGQWRMNTSVKRVIAERRLAYAHKDDAPRIEFSILIHEPTPVDPDSVDFDVSGWTSECVIGFRGLEAKPITVYGADSIQALELAIADVEAFLRRLSKRCDVFFDDGEPYFED